MITQIKQKTNQLLLGLMTFLATSQIAFAADDEGFGSLDQELLKKVLSVLEKTAGNHRLVGIISHVKELKDRIEKKIVVTKSLQKGSIVEILGNKI